jgi:hypothetical protein
VSITDHTTSTDTQQCIELPPSLMGCITALAADARLTAGVRLTGVLMMIYGWAWYERQESIDPTAIAMPKHQWFEVCSQLVHGVPDDTVTSVNLGLSFMNSGPSAYDERA